MASVLTITCKSETCSMCIDESLCILKRDKLNVSERKIFFFSCCLSIFYITLWSRHNL